MICGGTAWACPDYSLANDPISFGAAELSTPQNFDVIAGGEHTLESCRMSYLGYGQFRSAPDFSFEIGDTMPEALTFAVESSCDPALLVNAPTGEWFFVDDYNGLNPALTLMGGYDLQGRVDVWVGTYAGNGCEAVLNVQAGDSILAPETGFAPVEAPENCPDPALQGSSLSLTGAQLTGQGRSYDTTASAGTRISGCDFAQGNDWGFWGYASQTPQFTLNLADMQDYNLITEIDSGCDPTLLLNDANGNWHFDDDGGDGLQSMLELSGDNMNGRVSVWVGTFGGQECAASIQFSTIPARDIVGDQGMFDDFSAPAVELCPNLDLAQANPESLTGERLYSPYELPVNAGGEGFFSQCEGMPSMSTGYISQAPTYSAILSGMQDYGRLEIEAIDGCDLTLLVHTPDGQWHFNDDGNGNLLPLLNIESGAHLNGQLDIWVGTYGQTPCEGVIEIETWLN